MRYLLMMHAPRGTGEYEIFNWAPDDFQAHMAHLQQINRELTEAGEWVDALALAPPAQAVLVRAGTDGAPVTDDAFPETKEFLAGYWLVDVDSPGRAYAIAARASAAPGPGGAPLNMPIEVRQVMSAPPAPEA
ncbi:MAG TPA: YciI family protein [Longimicrobiales bacterium]